MTDQSERARRVPGAASPRTAVAACPIPGTRARPSCWPGSGSRRWPPPAAGSPPPWAGSTARSTARRRSRTARRWWRRSTCRCRPTWRTASSTRPPTVADTARGAVASRAGRASRSRTTPGDDEPRSTRSTMAAERVAGGGRGRARGADAHWSDRALRELPARPPRPRRHDRAPAGLPGGRRRRPVLSRRHRRRDPGGRVGRSIGRSTCSPVPGTPPVSELAELGVSRISVGRRVCVRRDRRAGAGWA